MLSRILIQAKADAAHVRQEADDYVVDTLRRLEMEMDRMLGQVRNGIVTLENERQAGRGSPEGPGQG